MDKKHSKGLRTWIEIDKKALKNNFKVFRKILPKNVMLGAVVKSNAYGHDIYQFSKEVARLGADWLMVDSVVEALTLRREGVRKPILILGYTLPERTEEVLKSATSLTISSIKSLEATVRIARRHEKRIKVHIKVDTGLSRQGFLEKDRSNLIKILRRKSKWIKVEGLYTHFSSAKDPKARKRVEKQLKIFNRWVKDFKERGFEPIVHAGATGGTLLFPEAHFDMTRIGIGIYGLWPSLESRKALEKKVKLKPILTWKTIASEVKELPKGSKVGYDGTKVLNRNSKVAICPIGYWHGYNRSLSNNGVVLTRGKRARVIGRISMDMIIIDITGIKVVKEGDEVVLIGKQGKEEISAYEVGERANTSWYEIVTCLNPLIKRIYF